MAIPTYDALMLPALRLCAERVWPVRELVDRIARDLRLTEDELSERLLNGESVISSRVQWALTYMKQAGLLERPKRAHVTITQRGREVLSEKPDRIDATLLRRFEEFRAFQTRTRTKTGILPREKAGVDLGATPDSSATPEEAIEAAARTLDEALRDALLSRILEQDPTFFEKMIVDLLLAMGYGGARADAGERLGGTGDGGVDGIIREDQLGLDRVYLQAKRYQPGNSVSSEAVQAFIGALVEHGAQKGVLITTSSFSNAASKVVAKLGSPASS